MEFTIYEIEYGTPEYDECIRLRYRGLRQDLGMEFSTEQIENEYLFIHFACYSNINELVGTLMMVPISPIKVQMKQVVVNEVHRNKGIGRALVLYAEHWAKNKAYKIINLHARDIALEFYLQLGYEIIGDPFIEITIKHYEMQKILP